MGLIVDTSVFIQWERRGGIVDLSSLDPTDDVFISVVTVSARAAETRSAGRSGVTLSKPSLVA